MTTDQLCDECGHDAWAHARMVDAAGELIAPQPDKCLECGCLPPQAVVDVVKEGQA